MDATHPAGNFRRTIYQASIGPAEGVQPGGSAQMLVLYIRGSAFLWHQVRRLLVLGMLCSCSAQIPQWHVAVLQTLDTIAQRGCMTLSIVAGCGCIWVWMHLGEEKLELAARCMLACCTLPAPTHQIRPSGI